MSEELVHKLRSLASAYPEDIFGPVSPEEVKEHASLITRNSAAMGRHFSRTFTEAADTIERLEHEIQALTGWPPHDREECAYCQRTDVHPKGGSNG